MPITGNAGNIKVATVLLSYFTEWSLNTSVSVANTTAFGGSGWEDQTPTIKKWSGSAKGSYDHTSHGATIALMGTVVAVEFQVDGTHKWAGNAILDSVQPKATSTSIIELSLNFSGTGALTYS